VPGARQLAQPCLADALLENANRENEMTLPVTITWFQRIFAAHREGICIKTRNPPVFSLIYMQVPSADLGMVFAESETQGAFHVGCSNISRERTIHEQEKTIYRVSRRAPAGRRRLHCRGPAGRPAE
jgi:hypothetical protein